MNQKLTKINFVSFPRTGNDTKLNVWPGKWHRKWHNLKPLLHRKWHRKWHNSKNLNFKLVDSCVISQGGSCVISCVISQDRKWHNCFLDSVQCNLILHTATEYIARDPINLYYWSQLNFNHFPWLNSIKLSSNKIYVSFAKYFKMKSLKIF